MNTPPNASDSPQQDDPMDAIVAQSPSIVADADGDLPKMDDSIDTYIAQLTQTIASSQRDRQANVRTTDYTITRFEHTKRDRLWALKVAGEFVDSTLLCPDDGTKEFVHIDLLLGLEPTVPFFKHMHQADHSVVVTSNITTTAALRQYQVDLSIPSSYLREIVYFAYHRRCSLTDHNSVSMAEIAAKFGITSLVQYCLTYMLDHCNPTNVIKGLVLSSMEKFANAIAKQYFQKYIEDHFEQVWLTNQEDILSLPYSMMHDLFSWEKLNIKTETTVWMVMQAWVGHDRSVRLANLAPLIKETLRFGRLPEQYIKDSILNSELFVAQPIDVQHDVVQFMEDVMHCEHAKKTITDGHGLLFGKSIIYFRPRHTKQLLVAAGGWIEGRTTFSMEVYDYQLNLWLSTSMKLPGVVSYFGFEVIGSTIYVFGGSNGREIFKSVSAMDLSQPNPIWSTKCAMIERRCYVSSVVLNGYIFAIGGFNQVRRVRKCERYDPTCDTWTEIADLNYARSDASATAFNGRIYIAGGINDNNIEQSVEVFNMDTNQWLLVKHMANPRTSFALTCYGERIWAIGGNDGTQRLNSVESYDPDKDVWQEERPLCHARSTFRAITFNGELYAVGGYNGENPIRVVEKYLPNHGWVKMSPLMHERSGLALIAIPNEFGIIHI